MATVIKIDDDTDYGSDFSAEEEHLVDQILARLAPGNTTTNPATDYPPPTTTLRWSHNGRSQAPSSEALKVSEGEIVSSRLAQRPPAGRHDASSLSVQASLDQDAMLEGPIDYPDLSNALSDLKADPRAAQQAPPDPKPQPLNTKSDSRSLLQRFRSFPRRPLTVSDMAAGAWCELQHYYTLTRLPGGKKTMTKAMQGGSRVHQKLEDEVHTTVRVHIASKEEAFALRLWNIIQGLRTLRDTGITRELEVWGTIDGEVFNGVIDMLTHESSDTDFEAELNIADPTTSTQQSLMTEYIGPSQKTVYLTDVKTRGSDRLPNATSMKPAKVQLYLYHRLLSDMVAQKVDYSAIFKRYGINSEARFSDAFIAQIGSLHDEIFYDAQSEMDDESPQMYPPDTIGYRTTGQIIPLLETELKETFTRGPESIGNLLAVQYRHRDDGRILHNNSFANDPELLDDFVKDNLRWWRGERAPDGVAIEETFKCNWCEFADSCQWRKDKEEEFLRKRTTTQTQGTIVGCAASAS